MSYAKQANKNDEHEIKPTDSQKRILELMANGCNQSQASQALGISRDTPKMQLKLLRQRLGVHTVEQCVALAAKRGWIRVDDYPRVRN